MLSPAARRLRRAIAMHHELEAAQTRLTNLMLYVKQDVADAKLDVEEEERREQAHRTAARLGV